MKPGLELTPIPANERRATLIDVALIFAGANIVTTTLVTGGSLGVSASWPRSVLIVLCGVTLGTLPLALLARLGPRTGLPSMVLVRAPFGRGGAAAVSLLLVLTNFAWIALNNLIAAAALSHLIGGTTWRWSIAVGAAAVLVALTGPRSMALFDRVAVPLMVAVGLALSYALAGQHGEPGVAGARSTSTLGVLAGLDIVVGYQVSWSLMFADYTRYQRSEVRASLAVFLGLSLSSVWLMLVGARAAGIGGNADPTSMILGLGLPLAALLIMALSTITTNFVNLYLSSLALKNLRPSLPAAPTVLAIGAVGTGFGLLRPDLLGRYAGFMEVLGTLLLPIVAVLVTHYFLGARAAPAALDGREPRAGIEPIPLAAWAAGALVYRGVKLWLPELGATLPTLAVTCLVYVTLRRR